MPRSNKTPLRMCIGCQEMKIKQELFRLVTDNGKVLLDISGKKQGRGAYICKNNECLKRAQKFKRLEKAFSQSINNNTYDMLEEQLKNNSDGGEYFV